MRALSLAILPLACLLLGAAEPYELYVTSKYSKEWFEHYNNLPEDEAARQDIYAGIFPEIDFTDYGDSYTPEELAALDRALWAGNMTRDDLNLDKDFGKGYGCFPAVREMLDDPLSIAAIQEEFAVEVRRYQPMSHARILELFDLAGGGYFTGVPLKGSDEEVYPPEQSFSFEASSPEALAEELLILARMEFYGGIHAGRYSPSSPAKGSYPLDAVREFAPAVMTWHDTISSPFTDPASISQSLATDYITPELVEQWHEKYKDDKASVVLNTLEDFTIFPHDSNRYAGVMSVSPAVWSTMISLKAFPLDRPYIVESGPYRIGIGTRNSDTWQGRFDVLIDPGGDDVYHNCRIGGIYGLSGHSVSLFVDLGGDDLYNCADVDITLGAAVLGVAAFYDLGAGNDCYFAGSVSLGAAIGGIATFYDDGGSDTYSGKVYTQGAAGFGIGIMCDDSVQPAPDVPTDEETPDPIDLAAFDNDTYTAWSEAQAFARTRGIAICTNARGNETYHAGGVYLHAPLFTDRYQSFSQGFAIGERDIDYAGGIALLADYAGNDRYLGDVYNQGVGYWYSAGFLYDGAGNDHYEMTQYGQGSGIHLAVGGLIDEGGSDCYIMHNGLGQGSSHDYAASVFMDRGGDDRYLGNTTCNGSALTNSVGLFFDRGGNDVYAGKRRDAINYGAAARGFGSIGVFVDAVGEDDYLGQMGDDMLWLQKEYGLGIDVGPNVTLDWGADGPSAIAGQRPAPQEEGRAGATPTAPTSGFDTPSAELQMPAIISHAGPLTQAVFDELWEIAIRWEVGDNRVIVPAARQRLVAFGVDVLPFVEAEMNDPNSLAVRAYNDVLDHFVGADAWPVGEPLMAPEEGGISAAPTEETAAAVLALLRRQLTSPEDERKTTALRVIGDLKLAELGDDVAALIDHPDPAMQRRAIGVLGLTGSHAADERLLALLDPATDEALLKVVVETTAQLRIDAFDRFIPLLGDPRFAVRDTLVRHFAAQYDHYGPQLLELLMSRGSRAATAGNMLSPRALRSLIRVYSHLPEPRTDVETINTLSALQHDGDAGVAEDARALIAKWAPPRETDAALQRTVNHIIQPVAKP